MFNIGSLFQMVGTAAQYKTDINLANEQMERAQKLKDEAAQVKAPALRSEFSQALKLSALRTITGMPDYGSYEEEIKQNAANQLLAGRESAGSGAEYGYYAAMAASDAAKQTRELQREQTGFKANAVDAYGSTLWNVGNEQKENEGVKRDRQDALYQQSSALEDASTANRHKAISNAISGTVEAASSAVGSGMGAAAGKVDAGQLTGAESGAAGVTNPDYKFDYNQSGLSFAAHYNKPSIQQSGVGVKMLNPTTGKTIQVPFNNVDFYKSQGFIIQ